MTLRSSLSATLAGPLPVVCGPGLATRVVSEQLAHNGTFVDLTALGVPDAWPALSDRSAPSRNN